MSFVELMTLAIDCGGLSIKASVLDSKGTLHAQPISTPTPYPLSRAGRSSAAL
jgi:polyphosphate glucokinase